MGRLGPNAPSFQCVCGVRDNCIDKFASGRGFEVLYEHYYKCSKCATDIQKDYANGDAQAGEHVDRFLDMLAMCLSVVIQTYDPEVMVFGGGLSNWDVLYTELPKRIKPLMV